MKIYLSVLILFICQGIGLSQNNYLLTIDQLTNRVKSGKDTTYIINFWATWCGPCIKEIPHFEKMNEDYKLEKVKVLLISVDFISQLESSVIPFIKKRKLKSEVRLLNESNQQGFINRIDTNWSGSIPATLFIKNNKRKFIEKEFTYPQLVTEYKNINR